jgi:hypothetical protein
MLKIFYTPIKIQQIMLKNCKEMNILQFSIFNQKWITLTNCTPTLNFREICSAVLELLQMNRQTGKANRCIFAFFIANTPKPNILYTALCAAKIKALKMMCIQFLHKN